MNSEEITLLREEKKTQIEKWKNRKQEEKADNKRKKAEEKEKQKEETKKRQNEKAKQYYKDHKEQRLEYNKKYKESHKDSIKAYDKKHKEDNKEKYKGYMKKYIKNNPEKIREYRKKWMHSKRAKVKNLINTHRNIRGRGFNSINQYFEGSHYHHMYLNGSQKIGMFIPVKLHRSVIHDGRTKEGLREINKLSLLWLCEQSTILKETL
jgi:hypothetical protein